MIVNSERHLRVFSPLGDSALIGVSAHIDLALNKPFNILLRLQPQTKQTIVPQQLMGLNIGLCWAEGEEKQFFNGIVSNVKTVETHDAHRSLIDVNLTPWFSELEYDQQYRIFENKSSVDIFQTICQNLNFHDFSLAKLTKKPNKRDYVVQNNENTFDFLTRLLREDGLNYIFEHTQKKHTLILLDLESQKTHLETKTKINLNDVKQKHIERFSNSDYDHTNSQKKLGANYTLPQPSSMLENYHYTARFNQASEHQSYNYLRALHAQTKMHYYTGTSEEARLDLFHTIQTDDLSVYMTNVTHKMQDESGFADHHQKAATYSNTFIALPITSRFASLPENAKTTAGTETQISSAKQNDTSNSAALATTKQSYHWDTEAPKRKTHTRVLQAQLGHQFIPRNGSETLNLTRLGDTNQNLIIGQVYDSQNKTPFDTSKTPWQSGFLTSSWASNGQNQHQLQLDDTTGKQLLYLHSSQDGIFDSKANFHMAITQDADITIKKDTDIQAKKTVMIHAKQTLSLKANGAEIILSPSNINVLSTKIALKAG